MFSQIMNSFIASREKNGNTSAEKLKPTQVQNTVQGNGANVPKGQLLTNQSAARAPSTQNKTSANLSQTQTRVQEAPKQTQMPYQRPTLPGENEGLKNRKNILKILMFESRIDL